MNFHAVAEGDIRRSPADIAKAVVRFPIRAADSALGFEGVGPAAENRGHFIVPEDGAIHAAGAKGAVRVGIQLDEHPVHAAPQVKQGIAPGTGIFDAGRVHPVRSSRGAS